jgi:D-amino-acid oxidase
VRLTFKSVHIRELYDDRSSATTPWFKDIVTDFQDLTKASLPSKATTGYSFDGLVVDPSKFLPWIRDRLEKSGVQFVRKTVGSLAEVSDITSAAIIVNASGLGARKLANDDAVEAVRGQTMLVSLPAEHRHLLQNAFIFEGSEYTYAIPRPSSNSIVLGGIKEPGSSEARVDMALRLDILRRINAHSDGAFSWLDASDPHNSMIRDIVGFRPGRRGGLRVERVDNVVHAYGPSGLGYLYAFGMASRVIQLIHESDDD